MSVNWNDGEWHKGIQKMRNGLFRVRVFYYDAIKEKRVPKERRFSTVTECKKQKRLLPEKLEQESRQKKADLEKAKITENGDMLVGTLVKYHLDHFHGSPATLDSYISFAKHIYANSISDVKIAELTKPRVQEFVDSLVKKPREYQTKAEETQFLSAKTVRNTFGVLQGALRLAVDYDWIHKNPALGCKLPKQQETEIHVFSKNECKQFCKNVAGNRYEILYLVDLFTGMRSGEIRGLSWDAVDFEQGTINVYQQIIKVKGEKGLYSFKLPKYDKKRMIKPAPVVMQLLRRRKAEQQIQRKHAGILWNNRYNLVFTNEIGDPIAVSTLRNDYKNQFKNMDRPEMVFHDLRHTYAVNSILAAEDIKSLSANMGHTSVAFTLDRYAKFTHDMRDISAKKQQQFIEGLFDDEMDESAET